MCDQTEVLYSTGDVVWVKLGTVWWPGQVQDYNKLPREITIDFRKRPIAVVKFFQEETFEYVKNINHIYQYNCRKKEEFIKKGLDMVRNSNSRDVPSNMKMFPNDIVMAEHLTGGNPNILDSIAFAPEQKSNYSELFGGKKFSKKKEKGDYIKKEGVKTKKFSLKHVPIGRRGLPALLATVPRPITHPRFINKALKGESDHEVRIRCQIPTSFLDDQEVEQIDKRYKCYLCNFQTARLNVIVLHNKSHSASFIEAEKVNRAKIKIREKERVTPVSSSFNEQSTTVTSRGRVKSLPKKLIDYTDEPPPKMLKEKVKSPIKEDKPEVTNQISSEKSPSKTPKKQKDTPERKPIKRLLFGKRKTAKEKAEIAAKIKQEHEAMKETLLKDWDDDDVNEEEEVELERLKQALESTTASSTDLDSSIENLNDSDLSVDCLEKSAEKVKKNSPKDSSKSHESKSDVNAKVFEFDDSEDSIPVNINFRLKKQSEKFTDDKFKKPKPPKPLVKTSPKAKATKSLLSPLEKQKEEEDKECAEFNKAFNDLLEETSVPLLPEIPKTNIDAINADEDSDQTDDITSSTDILEATTATKGTDKQDDDVQEQKQEFKSEDLQMECTSSDTEEHVLTESKEDEKSEEHQKNFKGVSATDPSVEMDVDFASGVAATSSDLQNIEKNQLNLNSACKDIVTTEISSSEDIVETDFSGSQIKQEVTKSNLNQQLLGSIGDENLLQLQSASSITGQQISDTDVLSYDVNNAENFVEHNHLQLNLSCTSESQSSVSESIAPHNVQGIPVKRESVHQLSLDFTPSFTQSVAANSDGNLSKKLVSTDNLMNVQLVLPASSESNSSDLKTTQQEQDTLQEAVPKLEFSDSFNVENQNMSQNLQDMELDINSMPVIIGGEDFIQPEEPKSNLIQIQPKYSESIVISPKAGAQKSPKKSENLIMHIGEPSTSGQNVIAIANKGGRGGRGGRSQKSSPKTIKLPASALKSLGLPHKSGNQQVLILKTTSTGQVKPDGGTLQKGKVPLNLIQHGSKILIVNNPQMSGQNKIKLNPQQQQLLSGGKLAPGTRVFTSKIVATTSQGSTSADKTSTSKVTSKPTQKLVISKGGLLSSPSKGVIINSSTGKLMTTVPGNITTSKGQTLITQSVITSKGLIIPSSATSASPSKTTAILSHQGLPTSKGMILTPISKGDTIISGNQKLRIVSSKAPLKGTKLLVQNPQGKISPQAKGQQVKLISGLKGQAPGNTILIQTSQGLVAKTITSSQATSLGAQSTIKTTEVKKSVKSANQTKILVSTPQVQNTQQAQLLQKPQVVQDSQIALQPQITHQAQTVQQQKTQITQQTQIVQKSRGGKSNSPAKKTAVEKVRQSPNILQKPQRKSYSKGSGNRLISPAVSGSDQIVLSTTTSVPIVAQPTLVQGQVPHGSEGLVYLTVDEAGNYRQIENKSLITLEGNTAEAPQTIFIPADSSRAQDVGNIFLAIDDAGNIINITQPAVSTSFSSESTTPSQDILARALANTQVLQPETIIPDMDVSSALSSSMDSTAVRTSAFSEQAQYPVPTLSHSTLETSLTLNQPIMTPLEVPSVVSPNLGQISSNYLSSNLLTPKQKHLPPSMPLLSEESVGNQAHGESVYFMDGANNLIPATSGSQIFQLTIGENNVIMTSGAGGSVLPSSYQLVSGDLMSSQLVNSEETISLPKIETVESQSGENIAFSVLQQQEQSTSDSIQTDQQGLLLREALEGPQMVLKDEKTLTSPDTEESTVKIESNLSEVEMKEELEVKIESHSEVKENDNLTQQMKLETEAMKINDPITELETKHSLKRSFGEEHTVTSSSDIGDESKKMKMDER